MGIFLISDVDILKWILLVPVSLILLLTVVAFIIRLVNIKKDENKRQAKIKANINDNESVEVKKCYGGSTNIVSVEINMSRVSVEVKEMELVEATKIKELGANNVLLVGNTVKASFGDRSKYIYNLLKGDGNE